MSRRNSLLLTSCLVIALLAGGLWFFRPAATQSPPDKVPPASSPKVIHPSVVKVALPLAPPDHVAASDPAGGTASSPRDASAAAAIDAILRDTSLDNVASARALGALVQDATLSQEARAEALAHMLNLSVNNESTLLLPLLKSPDLPDSLAGTILTDALNRPLVWQADACLAIMARKTGKELHTQASEHLAFLTDEDHGDDVNAWTLAVRTARAKWEAAGQ